MSRLIPQRDMTGDEIKRCCSEARAIVNLCHLAACKLQDLEGVDASRLADDVSEVTLLAAELLDRVADCLEAHEPTGEVRLQPYEPTGEVRT